MRCGCSRPFPRPFAAASLKHTMPLALSRTIRYISAAIRRGLIEARTDAAAHMRPGDISAAIRRGLIEALTFILHTKGAGGFPRPFAAASLKHPMQSSFSCPSSPSFPRPFAAASLKHEPGPDG